MSLKVAVCGAKGRMGLETVKAVRATSDLELVSLIDIVGGELEGQPVAHSLAEAVAATQTDVCIDFTHPAAAVGNARICLEAGAAVVIGTSGMGESELAELRSVSEGAGLPVLVVPNFAMGAILMMRFSEEAARWMPDASIVEMHHPGKADAPSGTALHTAERIAIGRPADFERMSGQKMVKVEGALGGLQAGVSVHSLRLPGLVAHQMVVFGAPGETLTIRHDSLDRTSFMPGVLLALRRVRELRGLTVGLERLMFDEPVVRAP